MSKNCICCDVLLTNDNSYPKSYSCKACQKIANRKYKREHQPVGKKALEVLLATKKCEICNRFLEGGLFFILLKNVSKYELSYLQSSRVYCLDCIVRNNIWNKNKKTG